MSSNVCPGLLAQVLILATVRMVPFVPLTPGSLWVQSKLGAMQTEQPSSTTKATTTVKPVLLSGQAARQYTPPEEGFWSPLMKIGVTKTDAGNNYHFIVNFTVPDPATRPTMNSPYPFNLITIYGNQRQNGRRVDLPKDLIPSVTGDWKPSDPVRLEFDLPKENAEASQGWNLRFCIGSKSSCIPSSNLLLDGTETPKAIIDAPHIRVRNRSNSNFRDVVVNGKQYGDIKAGAVTRYQLIEHAYKYARISLSTDSGQLDIRPIDYLGERQLNDGHFTYVLTIQEGQLRIECVID